MRTSARRDLRGSHELLASAEETPLRRFTNPGGFHRPWGEGDQMRSFPARRKRFVLVGMLIVAGVAAVAAYAALWNRGSQFRAARNTKPVTGAAPQRSNVSSPDSPRHVSFICEAAAMNVA